MISLAFEGPLKNFSPPGESSMLDIACIIAGRGASSNVFRTESGSPIPVIPQAPILPCVINFFSVTISDNNTRWIIYISNFFYILSIISKFIEEK